MTSDEREPQGLDPTLERVYRRGYQLRFRRKIARAVSASVALSVIVTASAIGIAKVGDRNERPSNVAIVPRSTGSAVQEPSGGTSPLPSQRPTAELTSGPSSEPSATPASCHNSQDKRCGRFYWITKPGSNAPVKVTIVVTTENPVAGEPVSVEVTVSDADAPHVRAWDQPYWGDPGSNAIGFALCLHNAYGGWSPPHERSGTGRFTFSHTYAGPGSYRFSIGGASNSGAPWHDGCVVADPYGGEETASTTIVVGPGAEATSTPSPTST